MSEGSEKNRDDVLLDAMDDLEALADLAIHTLTIVRSGEAELSVRVEYADSDVMEAFTAR